MLEIILLDIVQAKCAIANGKVKATVTLTKMVDGKEVKEEKVFEGDDLEVEAKIAELGK
jgi:K(+)-stimulated pyrophosphate-energized sodium pump